MTTSVIPGGVNSPVRAFKGLGTTAMKVVSGSGDEITDTEGKRYVDFCMSWGPLILGHAHPEILAAVQKRMVQGTTFGINTEIEEKV